MLPSASTQPHPAPLEFDNIFDIREIDAAGKKEKICFFLRYAISYEYREYAKGRKLKSGDPSITHERCITFVFDHPNPGYGKIMTYRLCLGLDGVILSPVTPHPDPEIAPFLEPVNLSHFKNEFFNPADFEPRKRKLTAAPIVAADQTVSKQSVYRQSV